MKLPDRKLINVDYFRTHFCLRKEKSLWNRDEVYDLVEVHYKPEPIVGEWAEWGIFYYLFGWLRLIRRPSKETYRFDRVQAPAENENQFIAEMQPGCEELVNQLRRHA